MKKAAFRRQEASLGDLTCLICLDALAQASQDLKDARCRYAQAALTVVREKLEQVISRAFAQQSFGPIEALFCEEEAARRAYEEAVAQLTQAEERCLTLRAALASEQALMLMGALPRQRLH